MDANINTRCSLDPSLASTSPEDKDSGCWSLPWKPSEAPSISQLAQSRAQNLDSWSDFSHSGFDRRYPPESDIEKHQDDSNFPSTIPSSSASDVFIPASEPQPAKPEPPPPLHLPMTRTREYLFIFITCIAQFLSLGALNQTVAPVMVLAEYFHIEDYGTLSWFSASFSMSVGTFILPAGMFLLFI